MLHDDAQIVLAIMAKNLTEGASERQVLSPKMRHHASSRSIKCKCTLRVLLSNYRFFIRSELGRDIENVMMQYLL